MARKYNVNTSYFKTIDTPEKAYWLGFIAADGCVTSTGHKLQLAVSEIDKDHLESFKQSIGSEHPISVRNGDGSYTNCADMYCLTIGSKEICNDLISHGITPRKSNTLEFPVLDVDLESHFIRGYFDGDGFISNSTYIYKNEQRKSPMVGFTETYSVLESIREKVPYNGFGQIGKNGISDTNKRFAINGSKKVKVVYEYLYTDSEMCLPRKKEKFVNYFGDLEGSETIIAQPNEKSTVKV